MTSNPKDMAGQIANLGHWEIAKDMMPKPSCEDERIALKILADPEFDVGVVLMRMVSEMVMCKDRLIKHLIEKHSVPE